MCLNQSCAGATGRAELVEQLSRMIFLASHRAAGTNDHAVYVYDFESRRCLAKLGGHRDDVNAVSYVRRGMLRRSIRCCCTCQRGSALRRSCACLHTGCPARHLSLPCLPASACAAPPCPACARRRQQLSPDSDPHIVVCGSDDRAVRIWDLRLPRRQPQGVLLGERAVWSAPCTHACKQAGTHARMQAGRQVRMPLHLITRCIHRPPPHARRSTLPGVTDTHAHPTHSHTAHVASHSLRAGHVEGITHICAKGDGRHLISNAKDQTVKLWDVRAALSPADAAVADRQRPALPRFDYRWMEFSGACVRPARAVLRVNGVCMRPVHFR